MSERDPSSPDAPSPAGEPPGPPTVALTGAQRKFLRGQAHGLRPVVQVGGSGVTDAVISALDRALLDHELVKVRMREPEDKKAMARQLCEAAGAELCGLVGHTVIVYRAHPDGARIALPAA